MEVVQIDKLTFFMFILFRYDISFTLTIQLKKLIFFKVQIISFSVLLHMKSYVSSFWKVTEILGKKNKEMSIFILLQKRVIIVTMKSFKK